ncbi:MAG TPA: hypothetical protein DEF61_00265 [Firmicutes bacterium]|nr:hypothetical protein [Bacillota bacterium]HBM70370.1 hypothetical protein [Bacillota bacterium]HBX24728.1 hypothetical protein [Bacillota bacterium]
MGNGYKIAGFVLGIVGIVCAFIGIPVFYLAFVGLPVSILGLVLSVIGNKKEKTGFGTAAFVLSLLATIFSAIMFVCCGLLVAIALGAANAANQALKSMLVVASSFLA